jgi:hypothetical protein
VSDPPPFLDCPDRPARDDPRETGFVRRRRVRWLSPSVLFRTGPAVAISNLFSRFADKREQQASIPIKPLRDLGKRDELWIDYVADLGDGFDATASVASAILRDHALTTPSGERVRSHRADLVIFGGDAVYPFASTMDYEDRTIGPYRSVAPCRPADPALLMAVPGNHDWYDGLTSFLRIFGQRRFVGPFATRQSRSYFAVKLPGPWWLWGIDIQFDTYIDEVQLSFFRELAERSLGEHDAVILCSAKPSWVESNDGKPEAYAALDYFERTIVRPNASVRLSLTGDHHHYVRYEAAEGSDEKITAGGGGAYTTPTHHLPRALELPPPDSRVISKSPPRRYERRAAYPSVDESRRLRWKIFGRIWRNGLLWTLPAVVYALLALAAALAARGAQDLGDYVGELRHWGVITVFVLTALALKGFTGAHGARSWVAGVLHALVHSVIALAVAGAVLVEGLDGGTQTGAELAVVAAAAFAGGTVGMLVLAAYLLVADRWRINSNELFAGMALTDAKCFLRIHVHERAGLTLYPIGIKRVPEWRFNVDDGSGLSPSDPWYVPVEPVECHLIEEPIRIAAEAVEGAPRPAAGSVGPPASR